MTLDSFPIWKELEEKVNDTLYVQNGMMRIFQKEEEGEFEKAVAILEDLEVPYEVLSAAQVNAKYKPFKLKESCKALTEVYGGSLMASKCLAAFQSLFKEGGGVLKDGEQVIDIIPGKVCTVVTNKARYTAKSLIITPGPFARKILPKIGLDLPLQPQRTHLCFWKLNNPNEGTIESGFPSFVARGSYECYGMASLEYPGLIKLCVHHGPEVSIDFPDAEASFENQQRFIREQMQEGSVHADKPAIVESCLYTLTPDHNFILDTHPKYPNIVVGAGFSGTGFKMSPITGKILAHMALGKGHGYDVSLLRMTRFQNITNTKSLL